MTFLRPIIIPQLGDPSICLSMTTNEDITYWRTKLLSTSRANSAYAEMPPLIYRLYLDFNMLKFRQGQSHLHIVFVGLFIVFVMPSQNTPFLPGDFFRLFSIRETLRRLICVYIIFFSFSSHTTVLRLLPSRMTSYKSPFRSMNPVYRPRRISYTYRNCVC